MLLCITICDNYMYKKIPIKDSQIGSFIRIYFVLSCPFATLHWENIDLKFSKENMSNSYDTSYTYTYVYSENPFSSGCFDIIAFENFCSRILIHFYKQRFYTFLWIYVNSLQALFPSSFAYWKLRTEKYREVMRAFRKKTPICTTKIHSRPDVRS